ncbi:MAG TPA: hypothetical protein VJ323_15920, partial [Bryobacteraceae bacterium]|nr:hypothetical protein [Bryobacteraceae bacterium]
LVDRIARDAAQPLARFVDRIEVSVLHEGHFRIADTRVSRDPGSIDPPQPVRAVTLERARVTCEGCVCDEFEQKRRGWEGEDWR